MNVFIKLAGQARDGFIVLFVVLLFAAILLLSKEYFPGSDYFNIDKAHSPGKVLTPNTDIPALKTQIRAPISDPIDSLPKPDLTPYKEIPKFIEPLSDSPQ